MSSIPSSMWFPTSSTGPSSGTPASPRTTTPSPIVENIAGHVLALRSLLFHPSHFHPCSWMHGEPLYFLTLNI
ncbi:Os01g0361800 [Oryza sativa Japonica Group]|nr:hypothetical protein EE612_002586 [Oryza sativa]BAS72105.1 Os01g0361800 [Oryza sativa Japonica Group]